MLDGAPLVNNDPSQASTAWVPTRVSAKVFDPDGDIVVTTDELFEGVGRVGGVFAVIVGLIIKIFPPNGGRYAWGHNHC